MLAILRLLLALAEVNERTSALEGVNMPALLCDAGLVAEAIAYCGGEKRSVPLAQAYDLAATLGGNNDPAGLRLFNSIEHHKFDDPLRLGEAGREHDAAVAWTRAAVKFRPCSTVLGAIQSLVEPHSRGESLAPHEADEAWVALLPIDAGTD